MIVWDLGEKMMDDMSADVMMDVVEDPVIPVNCSQPSPKVTPFLFKSMNTRAVNL